MALLLARLAFMYILHQLEVPRGRDLAKCSMPLLAPILQFLKCV